ncbi:MAG: hypothetical protein ACO3HF_06630 [Burkholderiaceae bacterium]
MQPDPTGQPPFPLQTGWFEDTKRVFGQEFKFYLYNADGFTTFAPGLEGTTVASNLPELFDASGSTYDSQARPAGKGDNITISLRPTSAFLEGIAPNPFTGQSALPQTLSNAVEGLYWEGSRQNDSFRISIETDSPTLQSIWYFGHEGDDKFEIVGDIDSLIGRQNTRGLGGTLFWGGEGNDSAVIPGKSSSWVIEKMTDMVGFSISRPNNQAASFTAIGVETIITEDETFTYNNDGQSSPPVAPGGPGTRGRRRSPKTPGAPNGPTGPGKAGRRRGSRKLIRQSSLEAEPENLIAIQTSANSKEAPYRDQSTIATDIITGTSVINNQGEAKPRDFSLNNLPQALTNKTAGLSGRIWADPSKDPSIPMNQSFGERETTLAFPPNAETKSINPITRSDSLLDNFSQGATPNTTAIAESLINYSLPLLISSTTF